MKLDFKNCYKIENWILVDLKNDIFCFFVISVFVFQKKNCFNENQHGFHMRYHLFLQKGCFLQDLEKDFIPTIMHTTVSKEGHWSEFRKASLGPHVCSKLKKSDAISKRLWAHCVVNKKQKRLQSKAKLSSYPVVLECLVCKELIKKRRKKVEIWQNQCF